MRKNRIRLSESALHRIVKESVKRVLRETSNDLITRSYQKSMQRDFDRHTPAFRDELDRRYSNQYLENDGFYKDMDDDEIRNTEGYKIAYNTLEGYANERDDEYPFDEWQTFHDVMEYTRIPQNIVWLAISDWKTDNGID